MRVVFLSRIHPKKGIVNLLQAWKNAKLPKNWKLLLIGPDEKSHSVEVNQEIERLGLRQDVSLVGNVDDSEKWKWLFNGDLFVLPSFSENFGIVIAEAMLAGLPVITTTKTPWQVLRREKMGWWVEPNVDDLTTALVEASLLSTEQRREYGTRCKLYAQQHFSWDNAAKKMNEAYRWLLDPQSTKPDCIV